MASFVSRLVACLVAVVALLQLIHLVLLNKLESRRLTDIQHHLLDSSPSHELEHRRTVGNLINDRQRRSQKQQNKHIQNDKEIMDSTGEFRIIFNIGETLLRLNPTRTSSFSSPTTDHNQEQLKSAVGKDSTSMVDDFIIDDENEPNHSSQEEGLEAESDVTLIIQSDLINVKRHLLGLIERWKGPISLSIFAQTSLQINNTIEFISRAAACHSLINRHVLFHLIFPFTEKITLPVTPTMSNATFTKISKSEQSAQESKKCRKFYEDLKENTADSANDESTGESLTENKKNYPINLLRNIARKVVQTQYSFVIDIDMLPSNSLRSKFQKFMTTIGYSKKNIKMVDDVEKKTVYVVPAFESKNGEKPETKKELVALLESYQARPFYFDLCWKCQVHTDYESWQRESPSKINQLSVLFEVLWKDPWEPFFISANNEVPLYDERFQNEHGYNRLSQLCELHMNGYKFAVLNDAFLIHPNFKTTESFYTEKNLDLEINRAHFRQFKVEMKDKYPHSTRRCY